MTLTDIAEMYLRMVPRDQNHARVYVRLAYRYGVPVGRIIRFTELPADVVLAYLEGDD